MANYHIPVKYLFRHILKVEFIDTPNITKKTIEIGCQYSPEFVCTPFKYTLGSYIEALDLGANVLLQCGGGCKYGYYSELQEQILKDLNYKFKMINLISGGKMNTKEVYNDFKNISKINIIKVLYYLFIGRKMVLYMDHVDDYIRKNIGFEVNNGEFENLHKSFLKDLEEVKTFIHLNLIYKKYRKLFKKIKIDKPDKPIKIAVIGELYTLMEPFANYDLEVMLARRKIEVTRYTNVDYLLFRKKHDIKYMLKESTYIEKKMGADAADNICRTEWLCENNYDGIVHIKATFCTPEIAAMPIIRKICDDYNIPVMFMSFDSNTSEVGVKTRMEAFLDMLEMRRNSE